MTRRLVALMGFSLSLFCVISAFYIEKKYAISPCLLCVSQRIIFGIEALLFLVLFFYAPKGLLKWTYGILLLVGNFLGMGLSVRQIWLQNHVTELNQTCLPGIRTLVHYMPWDRVLHLLAEGDAGCGQVIFRAMGLTLTQWSLIGFVVLAISGFFSMDFNKKKISS